MSTVTTVLDHLARQASLAPGRTAFSTWCDGQIVAAVSYLELWRMAERVGRGLRSLGADPGDRVVLVMPNDPRFAGALLGCVHAGVIAVPAPVPAGSRTRAFRDRLAPMVRDCAPRLLVTIDDLTGTVEAALPTQLAVRVVSWDCLLDAAEDREDGPYGMTEPDDALLLQYTSGSTGRPKGVVATHGMVAAQCAQARTAYAEGPQDLAVTWVPLFHDMGLVTGVLRPLYSGYPSVLMNPRDFTARPRAWLEAIQHCRGTLSSAPNFAYEHCVRKIRHDASDPLDLSSWRVARNAGEVVHSDTADRFVAAFAGAGFRAESFCPSYGMAEATLTVSTCGPSVPPLRMSIRRGGGAPERVETVISSGVPMPGTRVVVRDNGVPAAEGKTGELWISGPQVFSHYWPDHRAPLEDGLLRTGDLGFIRHGHVFVLGRVDDTLVVNGRNFYNHDIGHACAGVVGLRPGRAVAVKAPRAGMGDDAVWLVGEVANDSESTTASLERTAGEVRKVVFAATGLAVAGVGLLAPGAIPLTTSGKIRVGRVRDGLVSGTLPLIWQD
ncbi:AMP-binding protein [Plantactinospora sp. S1510]|uniref:AMP-binding protein n=1 Tax=Plantactinospora alkalitolerans TaxID=2789879 RepID=A0ABS0GVY4_9ACTN|nr:AMP-binding protein [Plantactinospora alkalitolerans]MBF9130104.1 AMP-binding protein [Plantactinospora alkalitolerans]